jgi:hypothetical protein
MNMHMGLSASNKDMSCGKNIVHFGIP